MEQDGRPHRHGGWPTPPRSPSSASRGPTSPLSLLPPSTSASLTSLLFFASRKMTPPSPPPTSAPSAAGVRVSTPMMTTLELVAAAAALGARRLGAPWGASWQWSARPRPASHSTPLRRRREAGQPRGCPGA
jgi:hypothetical protein